MAVTKVSVEMICDICGMPYGIVKQFANDKVDSTINNLLSQFGVVLLKCDYICPNCAERHNMRNR